MGKFIPMLVLLSTNLVAQNADPRYVFKMSPQHLALNILKIGFERINKQRTRSLSFYLNGALNDKQTNPEYYYPSFPYSGVGAEIQTRKYLNTLTSQQSKKGNAFMQSVYLAGFLHGGAYRWTDYYLINSVRPRHFDKSIAVGFAIGLQRTLWEVVVIDAYAGAGMQKGWSDASLEHLIRYSYKNNTFQGAGYTGVLPKAGLQIGIFLN
jgi:hypothetical protein